MLEENVAYEDGTSVYRAGYNPAFLAKVREKRAQEQKEAKARKLAEKVRREQEAKEEASKAQAIAVERVKEIKSDISAEIRFNKMIAEISMRVNGQNKIRVEDIIPIVAEKHRVTVADIKGACRSRKVIAARFEAIAEARRLRPDLSLTQLGRLFGKRDHTTIRHALVKMGMPTASIEGQKVTRRAA